MIFSAFFRALGQIGDRRFRRVVGLGIVLALALLAGVYALFFLAIQSFAPEAIVLPWLGEVQGVQGLLEWASLPLMLILSVFLMVPVASAFAGIFLETVVDAVEDRHYPQLPAVQPMRFGDAVVASANFLGLVIAANIGALLLLPFAGPAYPLVFWLVNGWLLGQEYFMLVAQRRLGRVAARDLRRQNRLTLWAAGTLMAAPLSLPLVNLVIPVLGVATFTHIFHRIARQG
jgi:CysZ protein